jgi:hypothetical protein
MVEVLADTEVTVKCGTATHPVGEARFPVVRWEQEVPAGQSLHSAQLSLSLKIAAVIMVFVFVAVYSASEQFWAAVMAALVVGSMGLAGDKMFKGGARVWDIHIPGPEPREGVAEEERRARATAMTEKEYAEALVMPDPETNELIFFVFRRPKGAKQERYARAPLASLDSFAVGTADEWFGDVAQAQLRQLQSHPNSYVIVGLTIGEGVLAIAESAGSRARIAHLQGILTKRFIVGAREIQERWKEKLEEAKREARKAGEGERGNAADAASQKQ